MTLGDVLRIWQGLGYPRRARNLHAAATAIVAAGAFPSTLDGLLALPGVGPYTARAVLAFAFERDVAIVDTNIARVLARVAGSKLTQRQVQAAADALVPVGEGWTWNQTMLDLGAGLCRARSPVCGECPIASTCRWFLAGRPDPDPALGSAAVSGAQARFDGSDRQGRGRLMLRLNNGGVRVADAAGVLGWPTDKARAERVLATLLHDRLVVERDGWLSLP